MAYLEMASLQMEEDHCTLDIHDLPPGLVINKNSACPVTALAVTMGKC